MKKYLLISLSVGAVLLGLTSLLLSFSSLKETKDLVLGERTSLFRPYIDVSGTSTARTSDTVGTSTPSSVGAYRSFIDTAATGFRGLVVRRVAGQTANLFEAQDETGGVLWSIGSGGAVSSSAPTSTFRNILPEANNTYDIGAFGLAWRSVYVSGTLIIGTPAASTTISGAGVYSSGPVTSTLSISTAFGSAAAPSFTFNTDEDTGMFRLAANNIGFAVAGANVFDITGARAAFNTGLQIQAGNGSAAAPPWSFVNNTDNGMFLPDSNNDMIAFSIGGAERLRISSVNSGAVSSTLSIFPATDNTLDLGSSTSTAWRSIYASSSVVVGGRAATTTFDSRSSPQGVVGRGTCIALTGTNGIHYFLSVTTTPDTGTGQNLAVSTRDCTDN